MMQHIPEIDGKLFSWHKELDSLRATRNVGLTEASTIGFGVGQAPAKFIDVVGKDAIKRFRFSHRDTAQTLTYKSGTMQIRILND